MTEDRDLRVLLLAGRFAVRGSCAYTLRLLEHMGQCGVAARMVCCDASRITPSRRQALGIREDPRLGGRLRWTRAIDDLADSFGEDRPDSGAYPGLPHGPSGLASGPEGSNVPYVLTIHDFMEPGGRFPLGEPWGLGVIAVSQAVADDLTARCGVPADRVHMIPGGVDVPPYVTPPNVADWEDRTFIVGTAGPLEKVKGQVYFLDAAKQIRDAGFDVEFLIAGSGPEEEHLRSHARELGIAAYVTFVPQVREYSEVLEAIDIFCLTSLQQGLGTVMLEAMALGKPVVASDVGGVHTVVQDNETGVLIPKQDSQALAGKVIRMLRNPQWARTLARNGQRLVAREFSAEHMVEHTATLYRRLLERHLSVMG